MTYRGCWGNPLVREAFSCRWGGVRTWCSWRYRLSDPGGFFRSDIGGKTRCNCYGRRSSRLQHGRSVRQTVACRMPTSFSGASITIAHRYQHYPGVLLDLNLPAAWRFPRMSSPNDKIYFPPLEECLTGQHVLLFVTFPVEVSEFAVVAANHLSGQIMEARRECVDRCVAGSNRQPSRYRVSRGCATSTSC